MSTPLRGRLALRIYLVSLTQVFVIVAATGLLVSLTFVPLTRQQFGEEGQRVLEGLSPLLEQPAELSKAIARTPGWLSIYTADGGRLASSADPPLPAIAAEDAARLQQCGVLYDGPPPTIVLPVNHGALQAYGVYRPALPLVMFQQVGWAIAIVLAATALASLLLARSLAEPLAALGAVARQLGAGDLTARARLNRSDELGQLAHTFDDMADRLGQLLRSQQELLANVSHELRTPLARIRVALDLASEGDAEIAKEVLTGLTEDMTELERLVSDVLQTARLDLGAGRAGGGGLPPLHAERLDMGALLDKAVTRFRAAHPQRALELVTEGALPVVRGDAVLLRRAIENLLDNARKYSEEHTSIRLQASSLRGAVLIGVEDVGIGISSEDLPHVTTPFFRTDRSRARRTGGLGLGLSLARRIVEAHGGVLTIESQPGVGTTVRMSLPTVE